MIVRRYESKDKAAWDAFIASSKNGLFLFNRDYMDYHSDRFEDNSLLFLDNGEKIVALLPANVRDNVLISHGGLTFGGVVSDVRMTTPRMLEVFEALDSYLKDNGFAKVRYKVIPHIYHSLPAEEDSYALVRRGAMLFKREVSSTIFLPGRLPFSKGRKYNISKARKAGVEVAESCDYRSFMAIAEHVLGKKHGVRPVHTVEEITLLAGRFPCNIRLYGAYAAGRMLAGAIMYLSAGVAHVQYMASSDEGKEYGALDMVIHDLIVEFCKDYRYFDFGISTEQDGRYLNEGLIAQKEMFGARAVVHDTYEWEMR